MNRNLDGVYFRVKRGEEWQPVCFSDMTKAEMDAILVRAEPEFIKNLCKILGQTIRKIGDQLNIEMLPLEERSEERDGSAT